MGSLDSGWAARTVSAGNESETSPKMHPRCAPVDSGFGGVKGGGGGGGGRGWGRGHTRAVKTEDGR